MNLQPAATFAGLEINQEEIVTLELIDEITQTENHLILGATKMKLGYQSILLRKNLD
mgnify:FL=1